MGSFDSYYQSLSRFRPKIHFQTKQRETVLFSEVSMHVYNNMASHYRKPVMCLLSIRYNAIEVK